MKNQQQQKNGWPAIEWHVPTNLAFGMGSTTFPNGKLQTHTHTLVGSSKKHVHNP